MKIPLSRNALNAPVASLVNREALPRKKHLSSRDTFSFPDFDYVLLSELQQRCLQGGHYASKSELVRAGLKALIQMKSDELLRTAQAVEKLKPGRVRGRH